MGIRGTVRRSTDSWFVHCNVGWSCPPPCLLFADIAPDTDVILYEPDPSDPTLKPPETYTLIENFCLGLRRLEIFGRARTLRRGWVTALAEGEEELLGPQEREGAPDSDQQMVDGEEDPVKWDRESWETKIKELVSPGSVKLVVPMSSGKTYVFSCSPEFPLDSANTEIDALRPKSPVRGGSSNHSHLNNPPSSSLNAGLPNNPSTMAIPMAPQTVATPSPRVGTGNIGNSNFSRPNRDPQSNRFMGPPRVNMINVGGMSVPSNAMTTMGSSGVNLGGDLGGMGMGSVNMGMGMGMGRGLGLMPWQEMGNMSGLGMTGGMGGVNMGGIGGMGGLPGHPMGAHAVGPPRLNQNVGLSGGVSLGTAGMNMNSGHISSFGSGQQMPQMAGMGMGHWNENQFIGSGMGTGSGTMWEGEQGMIGMGGINLGMSAMQNGMGMDQLGNINNAGMGNLNLGMNQWG